MSKKKVYGVCRICGEEKRLTEEHYIPKSAGGGIKIKLYTGDELIKTLHKDKDGNDYKPFGKIKQSGLSEYSLCKECNEQSGILYDKDFARFFNGIHQVIASKITIPENEKMDDYLEGKTVTLELDIKPLNIAKRILVSFCSVEHPGLADRKPEIRKAIQNKNYHPVTKDFALYMCLHLGNSAYYGTIAAMKKVGLSYVPLVYAGIESDLIAFYYSGDKGTKDLGGLENTTDITEWLTKYEYDQVVTIRLELMFNKSMHIRFPLS